MLQKQKIQIPFITGLDTKTDEKQLATGKLVTAENALFENKGKIRKRTGYKALSKHKVDGSLLSNIKSITPYYNELTCSADSNFYAFSESKGYWIDKGEDFDIISSTQLAVKNEKEQSNLSCTYVQGYEVYTYQDSAGVHVTVLDTAKKTTLLFNLLVSTTGTKPKVASIGALVYIYYIIGASISYKILDLGTHTLTSATTLVTNCTGLYDINSIGQYIILTYENTSHNILSTKYLNDAEDGSNLITYGTALTTLNADITTSRLNITYTSATELRLNSTSSYLETTFQDNVLLETISGVKNSAAIYDGTNYTIFYEIYNALDYKHYIKKCTNSSGSFVVSTFQRAVGLVAKPFLCDSQIYIPVIHKSPLQSSVFILNESANVINSINVSLSGNLITTPLSKVAPIDSTTFLLTSQQAGRIDTENGTFHTLLGVSGTKISIGSKFPNQYALMTTNLHIANGTLRLYDGSQVVEHGFFLYPENMSLSQASTGGYLGDGTYQVCAVYTWTDATGLQHRSSPSVPTEITLTGGTSTQKITATVPPLYLTEKSGIIVEFYRTEVNGTIFYKCSSTTSPILNDKTADEISLVITASDTDLVSQEVLYTAGGTLENIALSRANIIADFKNRIFTAVEGENKIQYSKLWFSGNPVEFNDTLYVDVNPFGQGITTLKAMDDKLIILKKEAIFYLSGDGPNNTGSQDNFNGPDLVSSDAGCINKNSVVLSPYGIFFQSAKGIYLLDRSMQLQYVGAPVEKYNTLTITSAKIVHTKNLVTFTTSEGVVLVYNYFLQQWATFNTIKAIDSEIIESIHYILTDNSEILKESTQFNDNGTSIKLKVETGWLSFADIQGYQRVYRILLLGEFKSKHTLKVKLAYNFNDAYINEVLIDSDDIVSSSTYGTQSPEGSSIYGDGKNTYQIRLNPSIQKCESLKISIEDMTEGDGESLSLSNLLFVVGVKNSEVKRSSTYSVKI